MLIITITSMVLISIQPFAFKKIFLLVATLLCLSSVICLGDSLFMSLHERAYGHQLNHSQAALSAVSEQTVQPLLPIACQSLGGGFGPNSGWILAETFVLDPTIDWPAGRSK